MYSIRRNCLGSIVQRNNEAIYRISDVYVNLGYNISI